MLISAIFMAAMCIYHRLPVSDFDDAFLHDVLYTCRKFKQETDDDIRHYNNNAIDI